MAIGDSTLVSRCAAEFLGTLLPFFAVGFNVLVGNAALSGVSLATTLTVITYALAGISGANFNPAVSCALALSKKMGGSGLSPQLCGAYVAAQMAGGLACGLAYVSLFSVNFKMGPGVGFSWFDACLTEMIYTCFLCFVVLNTTAARAHSFEGNHYFGLAIGGIMLAGAYAAGNISGGFMNPAITIGIDLNASGFGFGNSLILVVSQMLGAVASVYLYILVRPQDFGKPVQAASKIIAEFIGTFALVLTVGLTVLHGTSMAVVAIAACLMAMVYSLGDVSGANFNPAVTVAIAASGRDPSFTPKQVGTYMATQMGASVTAGLTYYMLCAGRSFPLGPGPGFNLTAMAVSECFFTGLLCFVVLCVAVSNRTQTSQIFGLAIGLCIIIGGLTVGKISGACLNPAVAVSIALTNGVKAASNALRYSVFEILGGVAAGGLFRVTHADDMVVIGEGKPLV
eukprot:TRINITY_DN42698_c0_g1_i1.p1 TRINITY_DN42698_c0_g1~~TRINITY_DN42698_c0_g1_i1.p1  ORF type:complete len:495 (+),score=93.80 TRINITY_DN42698_c0_g1_i1:123-1487(+)